ncbi:hypothetical protein DW080_09655 [Bacteroides caccae]|nr:hypothetical protein DW080_09655 [Bacteroides caccae]
MKAEVPPETLKNQLDSIGICHFVRKKRRLQRLQNFLLMKEVRLLDAVGWQHRTRIDLPLKRETKCQYE